MELKEWLKSQSPKEEEFKALIAPWARYIIIDSIYFSDYPAEIEKWCKENLCGRYELNFYCYFEFEEDVIMYALKWS